MSNNLDIALARVNEHGAKQIGALALAIGHDLGAGAKVDLHLGTVLALHSAKRQLGRRRQPPHKQFDRAEAAPEIMLADQILIDPLRLRPRFWRRTSRTNSGNQVWRRGRGSWLHLPSPAADESPSHRSNFSSRAIRCFDQPRSTRVMIDCWRLTLMRFVPLRRNDLRPRRKQPAQ